MRSEDHREPGGAGTNILLALILGLMIVLHWFVLSDPSQRNLEILPDMVESVPRDAQAPVPALQDGSVPDLRPPTGSVARGYLPFPYGATPEEAIRAGEELQNPIPADDVDALARGQFIYTNFCTVCHGATGMGDGPATKRGVPPPPSLLLDHAIQMRDGQMFHLITLGQANMASYASQIGREDRWKVVHYVRTLQAKAASGPPAAPVETAAELTRPAGSEGGS